jgi:hypothetical protein
MTEKSNPLEERKETDVTMHGVADTCVFHLSILF